MRRFGVALGDGVAWVAPAGGRAAPRGGLARRVEAPAPGVAPLVAGLRAALGPGPARLDVALLPEQCHLRWIPLPPLTRAERRVVLDRTLGRHLPGDGPWAFGVEPAPGGALVAAAPREFVTALERALADAGFRLGSLRPAAYAWLAASGPARRVLIARPNRFELLDAPDGRIRMVRRLTRAVAGPDALRQFVGETRSPDAGPLALIATQPDMGIVEEMLAGAAEIRDASWGLGPETVAAAFATRAGGPEILTADAHARRERAVRRATRRLVAAAAGLALLAGAAAWWGTWRELAGLRATRGAQAQAVAEALALRERVTRLEERFVALDPGRGPDRAWSRVLADLAEHLPRTAFLTAFRAAGDSVSLEGYARETGPVLEALREAPAVVALRATAPIRREAGPGDAAVDRFALGVRLAPRVER